MEILEDIFRGGQAACKSSALKSSGKCRSHGQQIGACSVHADGLAYPPPSLSLPRAVCRRSAVRTLAIDWQNGRERHAASVRQSMHVAAPRAAPWDAARGAHNATRSTCAARWQRSACRFPRSSASWRSPSHSADCRCNSPAREVTDRLPFIHTSATGQGEFADGWSVGWIFIHEPLLGKGDDYKLCVEWIWIRESCQASQDFAVKWCESVSLPYSSLKYRILGMFIRWTVHGTKEQSPGIEKRR